MTRQEFIEELRTALNGRVSPGQVAENMRYYEDYINVEIRKGRSEEEVLAALGEPRLIARTIVETRGRQDGGSGYAEDGGQKSFGFSRIFFKIPLWVWLAIIALIMVLILGVVFSVVAALLPFLLPVLGVIFLIKLFRSWRG